MMLASTAARVAPRVFLARNPRMVQRMSMQAARPVRSANPSPAVKLLAGSAAVWMGVSSFVDTEEGDEAVAPTVVETPAEEEEAGAAAAGTGATQSDSDAAAAAAKEAMAKAGAAVFNIANSEYAGQISVGAVAGACSGYALKKVGKVAAFLFGVGFIGFQVARYNGLVSSPDWKAVDAQLVAALDTNGDGKVDMEDMAVHLQKAQAYLSVGLPSSTAFGVAFLLGLRYG